MGWHGKKSEMELSNSLLQQMMIPAWPLPTRGGKQLGSVGSFGFARSFLCSRISWTSGFFAALIIGQPASILPTWRYAEIEKSYQ